MWITTQLGRVSYLSRHIRNFMPYITPRKIANVILNFIESKNRVVAPHSYPPYLKIESTPVCHLRCVTCSHSNPDFKRQFNASMNLTLERFKRIIDPVASTTLGVSLSFRGEPMLNRELPKIAAYAHRKGIATSFPTSLSVPLNQKMAEEYILSGLDAIYISLDGATRETYDRYRIGGSFETILANTRLLAETKRRLHANHPRLIWKMVIFDYNRHEIPVQESTYRELGFDGFEHVLDNNGREFTEIRKRNNRRMIESKSNCMWLWNTMVITSLGNVFPCCHDKNIDLGNAAVDGIPQIWNGAAYRALRAPFATKSYGKGMNSQCRECIGLPAAEAPLVIPKQS
jgi:radical SAM protein with 4Fe4S-binding SPASM domain